MSLPPYYFALYCYILDGQGKPVGSGLCVDGKHIITCVHVINAAKRLNLESLDEVTGKVTINFVYNEDLKSAQLDANIVFWGWKDKAGLSQTAYNQRSRLIKHDLAILELESPEEVAGSLTSACDSLTFLKGELKGSFFESYSRKSNDPGTVMNITGEISGNDYTSGSAILSPNSNLRTFFFDSGSSGSPVFSTVNISPGKTADGIIGYVDFLNTTQLAADARMIHVQNIEEILAKYNIQLNLNIRDIDRMRIAANSEFASQQILESRGKEIFCDRRPNIESIEENLLQPQPPVNAFLIYGNERQLLDCFIDRYRLEFIAGKGLDSTVIFFKMPAVANKNIFCSRLLAAIVQASKRPFYKFSENDPDKITISQVIEELFIDDKIKLVIDCRVDNTDVNENMSDAYKWFFSQFMSPLYKNNSLNKRVHFFVSVFHSQGDAHLDNKQILLRYFPAIQPPELIDVKKQDVEDWLDQVEGQDIFRKNRIKSIFLWKDSYDMADVIGCYHMAINKIDSF